MLYEYCKKLWSVIVLGIAKLPHVPETTINLCP